MSSPEDISSKILSDVDIIADIYKIVKDAGLRATENSEVKEKQNDTRIIKANVLGLNRTTANCLRPGTNINKNCRISKDYNIIYDANDLIIVGGSALNIYDYKLKELKERREIKALEEYIKKRTSDIDIVWWPRMVIDAAGNIIDDEIVTATSPAIATLVQVFINEVKIKLEENKASLQTKIKKNIPNVNNSDILSIDVGGMFGVANKAYYNFKSGTYTVSIKFKIKGLEFKICEILFHDSGASQQFNEEGREITDLRYMNTDPIYCSPIASSLNHISYQDVNGINIAVPNILSFVRQQILAFSNLINYNKDREGRWNFKGFINYKRVEFIKKILESIKVDDETNKRDLLEVFKTSNSNYPSSIVSSINKIETQNIERLYPKILELCSNYNSSDDPIISDLCEKAKLQQWRNNKIAKLKELTVILHNQYKKAPISEFRRAYSDLERKSNNFKFIIEGLKLIELKNHNIYKGEDPVKIIETEKESIDRKLASRKIQPQSQNVRLDNTVPKPQKNMRPLGPLGEVPYPKRAENVMPPTYGPATTRPLLGSPPATMRPLLGSPPPTTSPYMRPPAPVGVYPSQSQMASVPFHQYGSPYQYSYIPQVTYTYGQPPVTKPLPIIPIYTNDRGNPYYVDPETKRIIVRNPYTGMWVDTGQPPQPPQSMGRKGKGGFSRTFKRRQSNNNTRKNN